MMEIWKEIKDVSVLDFEYEVSNMGEVRSMNYNRTGKVQNLKIRTTPTGNRCIMLGGKKVYSVAKLVLTTFVEPRPSEKHIAYHKDGDNLNDSLENLEWQHISVQNKVNGKKGFKFKKGHNLGVESRFKKGHTVGAEYHFKKGHTIGLVSRFVKQTGG
jgi:NUMOD4 motif